MKHIAIAILFTIYAAGCTVSQQAAIDAAIKSGQNMTDSQTKVLLATVCAITEGSKQRLLTGDKKFALEVLCTPE